MTGTYERPNGKRSPLDVTNATALDCAIAAADAAAQFAAECAAHQCAVTAAFGVPNPAALGPPLFSAAASKVPLPKRLGVLFQKKPTLIPTTTVIESLVIGKTATEVLK